MLDYLWRLNLQKLKFVKKLVILLIEKLIGFDINKKRISELENGHDNTLEIKSNEIEFLKKIFFTCNINDVIDSDVFIVTVPTPIDSQKIPDLKPLKSASEIIF